MAETNPNTSSQSSTDARGEAVFERARQTTEQLRGAAVERVHEVGEETRETLDRGKHEVAERLRRLGTSLQSMSSELSQEDRRASQYADKIRTRLESAANYVESANLESIVHDVERFARQKPAMFLGGAFAAGIAAARFLKSGARGIAGSEDTQGETFSASRGLVETDRDDMVDLDEEIAVTDIPRSGEEDLPISTDLGPGKGRLP